MRRQCPVCDRQSIAVGDILFHPAECRACKALVGVHRVASGGFAFLVTVVTLVSSLIVLLEMGLYAALLWFPFPIGALSYVKARFCPLEAKPEDKRLRSPAPSPEIDPNE